MPDTPDSLLEFPCELVIKVMGRAAPDFETLVLEMVRRHVGEPLAEGVTVRASRAGRYLAVSVAISAESRAALDALYRELSSHERVLMAL